MLAIAIHAQVINFPFFGQASADRDTLVNGVTTPISEFWSAPPIQSSESNLTPPHITCLAFYSCRSPQGTACINSKAAVLPPTDIGDRVGIRLGGSGLVLAWVNRGQDSETFKKFLT